MIACQRCTKTSDFVRVIMIKYIQLGGISPEKEIVCNDCLNILAKKKHIRLIEIKVY